jgi:hypothetical protein
MTIDPKSIKGRAVGVYQPPEPEASSTQQHEAQGLFSGSDRFQALGGNKWKAQIDGISVPDMSTNDDTLQNIGDVIAEDEGRTVSKYANFKGSSSSLQSFLFRLDDQSEEKGGMKLENLTDFPSVKQLSGFVRETGGNPRETKNLLKQLEASHVFTRAQLYQKQDAIHAQLKTAKPNAAQHFMADLRKVETALQILAREEEDLQAAWTHLL